MIDAVLTVKIKETHCVTKDALRYFNILSVPELIYLPIL
jgi:hypothetical protein